jgi:hypothetical protein
LRSKSRSKSFSITNVVFPSSIEIVNILLPTNAEPSIDVTVRGIKIDVSDDDENTFDSIRRNRELDSNDIDESDSQDEKHDEPRISIFRGIKIDDDEPK